MALLGPWPNRGRNSVYGFIGEGWGNVAWLPGCSKQRILSVGASVYFVSEYQVTISTSEPTKNVTGDSYPSTPWIITTVPGLNRVDLTWLFLYLDWEKYSTDYSTVLKQKQY